MLFYGSHYEYVEYCVLTCVYWYILQGASPLICTSKGVPALTLATINKHKECVQALLENDADVNMPDKSGNTALHEAINLGYEGKEYMDILLR